MKTVNFDNYSKSNYNPGSFGKRSLWYIVNHCIFKTWIPFPSSIKVAILKLFGCCCRKATIKPCVNIKYPWYLKIGNNVWIGEGVWIDNLAKVTIGNNVCLSQNAVILTGNHNYKKVSFDLMTQPVIIDDGAWIGANATVCPDTHIKMNCVITVGAVIGGNTEPDMIYRGDPAVAIRKRIIE